MLASGLTGLTLTCGLHRLLLCANREACVLVLFVARVHAGRALATEGPTPECPSAGRGSLVVVATGYAVDLGHDGLPQAYSQVYLALYYLIRAHLPSAVMTLLE